VTLPLDLGYLNCGFIFQIKMFRTHIHYGSSISTLLCVHIAMS